jgi:hypothetical protein
MAARVVFTAGFSRRYTGGVREFEIEARNLRGVIKAMDQLYPGLGHHLEEETTVAIDGALHETAYYQPIREGCEIFFIPKLEGGQGRSLAASGVRKSDPRKNLLAPPPTSRQKRPGHRRAPRIADRILAQCELPHTS